MDKLISWVGGIVLVSSLCLVGLGLAFFLGPIAVLVFSFIFSLPLSLQMIFSGVVLMVAGALLLPGAMICFVFSLVQRNHR